MTEPTPNLPLLRKVLDHIDAHPEEWNQRSFYGQSECGTTACVAGHAVAMTCGVAVVVRDGQVCVDPANGLDWYEAGREALGLTDDEAQSMFYRTIDHGGSFNVSTTREAVQIVAEQIAARAGERL